MKKILFLIFLVTPFLVYSQTDSTKVTEQEEADELPILVEKKPEYPGGEAAMYKFINKHIKYPEKARKEGIEGNVYVQFVIDKEGNVTKAKILRGIGFGCDKEALRIVNKMPKWKPGIQQGKPVLVAYTLPFSFKLK